MTYALLFVLCCKMDSAEDSPTCHAAKMHVTGAVHAFASRIRSIDQTQEEMPIRGSQVVRMRFPVPSQWALASCASRSASPLCWNSANSAKASGCFDMHCCMAWNWATQSMSTSSSCNQGHHLSPGAFCMCMHCARVALNVARELSSCKATLQRYLVLGLMP